MRTERRRRGRCGSALWLAALVVGLACQRADGPVPVAWDRTRCSHCGMLVSEPAFAAELVWADGRAEIFDDPGCLLAALAAQDGDPGDRPRLWFHAARGDAWLPGDRVAFAEGARSPMGYGLAAHPLGAPDAPLDLAAATAHVLAVERARQPERRAR